MLGIQAVSKKRNAEKGIRLEDLRRFFKSLVCIMWILDFVSCFVFSSLVFPFGLYLLVCNKGWVQMVQRLCLRYGFLGFRGNAVDLLLETLRIRFYPSKAWRHFEDQNTTPLRCLQVQTHPKPLEGPIADP